MKKQHSDDYYNDLIRRLHLECDGVSTARCLRWMFCFLIVELMFWIVG